MRKSSLVLVVVLIAFLVSFTIGCKKEVNTITIASKPVTEQYILAHILTLLIEEETDLTVKQTLGIGGGTSNIHPALLAGDIDLYAEYTGTGWLFVLKGEPISDPGLLYEQVKDAYAKEYQVHWSGLYGFNNTYTLAVSKKVADTYGLTTISDLSKAQGALVFAANPDFLERDDGFKNLVKTYGLQFKSIKEIDIGLRYQALASDQVDVISVFSTDAQLNDEKIVALIDDRNYFTSYYAATLVRQQTLDKYPQLAPVLEKLTQQISNEDMIRMNYQVEGEKQDPKAVAKAFLTARGLL